jgi:hypothetical protein
MDQTLLAEPWYHRASSPTGSTSFGVRQFPTWIDVHVVNAGRGEVGNVAIRVISRTATAGNERSKHMPIVG